jgi:hypothetical protein
MPSSAEEQKLKDLVRKRAQKFLDQPGITSVGVGYELKDGKPTGRLAIQFTVEQKLGLEALESAGRPALPETITDDDGTEVPVDVIQRSYKPGVVLLAKPEAATPRRQRRKRLDPIRPGISVSHVAGTAGTIGAIVFDNETGEPLILSNWHVLAGPGSQTGDNILQPGPFDGGTLARDRIGRLVRSHLGLAGDCAVASIEGRRFDASVLELNVVPLRMGQVNLGDAVVKSGRTTGVTFGVVARVGVVVNLNYGGDVGLQQIGGFEIRPNPAKPPRDGEISMGGDSGSCWLFDGDDPGRDVVVGLHFAGETDPAPSAEHALACNIHSVLEKLEVSLEATQPEARHERLFRSLGHDAAAEAEDPPPLSADLLDEIEDRLEHDRTATLERLRSAWDPEISERQLRFVLARARLALEQPEAFMEGAAVREAIAEAAGLPPDFTFPGMTPEIPIQPGNHKFEEFGDALGWLLFGAGPALFPPKPVPFRHAADFPSRFFYNLPEPSASSPLEIAVFSDFGTGLYHSLYIARQLQARRFPCAFHLGDVYYAGRKGEFEKQFRRPLDPMLGSTELFMLNSNHEMYSGSKWYFQYIDDKRSAPQSRQRQEGSEFCLRAGVFQIVGIDTAYHNHGRYPDQALRQQVQAALSQGKAEGRLNILLSADHPYKYGENGFTHLLGEDLREMARTGLIDLWFWGNTHYCALFDRSADAPFFGSCVGHGGFPYTRQRAGEASPVPVLFLETNARFPAPTKVRQDMGNNGYCLLRLHANGEVGLEYIDWMSNVRCRAKLARAGTTGPLQVVSVVPSA